MHDTNFNLIILNLKPTKNGCQFLCTNFSNLKLLFSYINFMKNLQKISNNFIKNLQKKLKRLNFKTTCN